MDGNGKKKHEGTNVFNLLKSPSPKEPRKKMLRKNSLKSSPLKSPGSDKKQPTLEMFFQKPKKDASFKRSLFNDMFSCKSEDTVSASTGSSYMKEPSIKTSVKPSAAEREARVGSSQSMEIDSSGDVSQDEDDLVELKFLTVNKKPAKDDDAKVMVVTDALQECHYKFSLETIFNERVEKSENDRELQQMEEDLMESDKNVDEVPKPEESGELSLDNFIASSAVKMMHPGTNVFHAENCFSLYQLPTPPVYKPDPKDMVSNILSQVPSNCFPTFVTQAHLDHCPSRLVGHPELLVYIYHLLASHPDSYIVHSCYKILASVQKHLVQTIKTSAVWAPSFKDVVTSVVNCGATFSKLLPSESLFPFSMDDLKSSVKPAKSNDSHKKIPSYNLQHIIQVLTLYAEMSGAYTNEELNLLLLICCGMMLHKNADNIFSMFDVTQCIAALLDQIDDTYWEDNVGEIAYQILQFTSHHHDMLYLVRLMPYAKRGLQLQKIAAFIGVHVLMGLDMEKQLTAVEPMHIVTFYKDHLLGGQQDYHWLNSVVHLVEFAIGFEIESNGYNRRILQKMVTMMRTTISKIRDKLQNPESTKVKNMIIRIATRWSLTALNMKLKQKTMFSYSSNSYHVEELPMNQETYNAAVDEEVHEDDEDNVVELVESEK